MNGISAQEYVRPIDRTQQVNGGTMLVEISLTLKADGGEQTK